MAIEATIARVSQNLVSRLFHGLRPRPQFGPCAWLVAAESSICAACMPIRSAAIEDGQVMGHDLSAFLDCVMPIGGEGDLSCIRLTSIPEAPPQDAVWPKNLNCKKVGSYCNQ